MGKSVAAWLLEIISRIAISKNFSSDLGNNSSFPAQKASVQALKGFSAEKSAFQQQQSSISSQ